PFRNSFASQIGAGPMGDVQSLGYRLQTSQADNLSALQGSNLRGTPRPIRQHQQTPQTKMLVANTGAPHRSRAALHVQGDPLRSLASPACQHNPSPPHLVPRQTKTVGNLLQTGNIRTPNFKSKGLAATHG